MEIAQVLKCYFTRKYGWIKDYLYHSCYFALNLSCILHPATLRWLEGLENLLWSWKFPWVSHQNRFQWIGSRENRKETIDFPMKYMGFSDFSCKIFPETYPLNWRNNLHIVPDSSEAHTLSPSPSPCSRMSAMSAPASCDSTRTHNGTDQVLSGSSMVGNLVD